jgi:acyl-CoA synthetase (AMP-forming)/AMP-acid ligase II
MTRHRDPIDAATPSMSAQGRQECAVAGGAPVATGSLLEHMDRAATAGEGEVQLVRSGERVRWSELWAEAHRCAGWLKEALPRDRVLAGLLEPSRECLVTLLGAWLAGRTFASLPHPSRGMGTAEYQQQIAALVGLVEATVVAAPAGLSEPVSAALPTVRALAYPDVGRARPVSGSEDARLVQLTSGSTDRPRGVALDMNRLGANAAAMAAAVEVAHGDVFFSWLPLSHDMGLVGMFLAPAAAMSPELGGATRIWLSDPTRFMRDALSWLRLASEVGGSITAAPNFALELVARRLDTPARHRRLDQMDLSSLRCLIVGSETVDSHTLDRFAAATATHGLRPEALCPAYGLAEATLAVTITPPRSPWTTHPAPVVSPGQGGSDHVSSPGGVEQLGSLVALGPPVPGVRLRAGRGAAEPAEIEVRGPSIAGELLGRPGSFTTDGWLRTGDLGFLHDGQLYFTGRAGDQLVVQGRSIDAGALQRRLGALDGVRPGCCATIQDTDSDGYLVVVEATTTHASGRDLPGLSRRIADAATRWAGASPASVLVVKRGALRTGLANHTIVPLHQHPTRHEAAATSATDRVSEVV